MAEKECSFLWEYVLPRREAEEYPTDSPQERPFYRYISPSKKFGFMVTDWAIKPFRNKDAGEITEVDAAEFRDMFAFASDVQSILRRRDTAWTYPPDVELHPITKPSQIHFGHN